MHVDIQNNMSDICNFQGSEVCSISFSLYGVQKLTAESHFLFLSTQMVTPLNNTKGKGKT